MATLVVALGLVAGACSGDDGGDGDAGSAPTSEAVTEAPEFRTGPPPEGTVATATVEGPVTGPGDIVLSNFPFDLATVGYTEEEYFLTGTASAYASPTELTTDGAWDVEPAGTADYATRVVVRRPSDPSDFNGTVLVEWLNVSGGLDAGPIWTLAHVEMIRAGYAWVGVSAQAQGVMGGGTSIGATRALKTAAPDRYATLSHPGDDYSYDIFSQAGAVVWEQSDLVLGALDPEHVLALGESQSAFRLSTYVDALDPLHQVYEGYLIHSRAGLGAPLSAAQPSPDPTSVRGDLEVPVLVFQTETDMVGDRFGYAAARQPDSDRLRTWEVAGTAHADVYVAGIGEPDDGSGAADVEMFQAMLEPPAAIASGIIACESPINTGPQTYVLRAAVDALHAWVRDGDEPPQMPPLEVDLAAGALATDELGNVLGGIRTPHVDAPVATLSGLGQAGGSFCFLFGTTVPFDEATIAELYPTADDFVEAWDTAVDDAVEAGALLPADADRLRDVAADSGIGG